MGFFSELKYLFKSRKYLINREILTNHLNEQIKFAVDNNFSAVDECYLAHHVGAEEEHIVITNNDAPCDCPLESEIGLTGITIYVNRTNYYDPKKDTIYTTVEEMISKGFTHFPEWFVFRDECEPRELDQYLIEDEKY